jgi:hypothetical protein
MAIIYDSGNRSEVKAGTIIIAVSLFDVILTAVMPELDAIWRIRSG